MNISVYFSFDVIFESTTFLLPNFEKILRRILRVFRFFKVDRENLLYIAHKYHFLVNLNFIDLALLCTEES